MSVKDNASPSQHHVSDTSDDTTEEEIDDSDTEKDELFIQPHWTEVTEGELKTYKEAIGTVNSSQWKKAMKKKVQSLKSNQTW